MALAVGADPTEALAAAEQPVTSAAIAAMVAEFNQGSGQLDSGSAAGLADEIERIRGLRSVPPGDRIRMVKALVGLYEEQAAAEQAGGAAEQ